MVCPITRSVIFQSTLPRRERQIAALAFKNNVLYFNPRSRVGSDVANRKAYQKTGNFNPRSRVGSDADITFIVQPPKISIHAPAWGATELFAGGEGII